MSSPKKGINKKKQQHSFIVTCMFISLNLPLTNYAHKKIYLSSNINNKKKKKKKKLRMEKEKKS
jgi:hypothetical protein